MQILLKLKLFARTEISRDRLRVESREPRANRQSGGMHTVVLCDLPDRAERSAVIRSPNNIMPDARTRPRVRERKSGLPASATSAMPTKGS
ncbi:MULTISPECIES: hypothetical protein [Mesorhizobium]|uniref:hypothetical protein n=1 Tax=Mesorhizobium sp. NZP2234 TaxID=2483402 RepID=UPI001FCD9848|nr:MULTISPECIES: hypothetical protein [Mesorhizobium]